jgi:hypothetical protein
VTAHFTFDAPLWEHDGEGGWHFVRVPAELSDEVRDQAGPARRGFGSLRVRATIGATTWTTSVFPDREGCYLLPVKKPVRRAEGLEADDDVTVALDFLDL